MGDEPKKNDADLAVFLAAMRGVRPLNKGPHRIPKRPSRLPQSPGRWAAGAAAQRASEAPRAHVATHMRAAPATPTTPDFDLQTVGETVTGRRRDTDSKLVRRLRQGEPAPEDTLDLHGLPAQRGAEALLRFVDGAAARGLRSILIVHGRGLHSTGNAVLKERTLSELQQPPLCLRILAFASAPPRLGGPGATLVLLRRNRESPPKPGSRKA